MSESENQNIRQEDDIQLFAAFEKSEESGEFYRQQAEFWAGECIAEQKKAHVSLMFMFFVSAMAFVAIGKAILSCQ